MRDLAVAVLLLLVGLAYSQNEFDDDLFQPPDGAYSKKVHRTVKYEVNQGKVASDDDGTPLDMLDGGFGEPTLPKVHHKRRHHHPRLVSKKTRNVYIENDTVDDGEQNYSIPVHHRKKKDDLEFDYTNPIELSHSDKNFIIKQLAKQEKLPQVASLVMGKKESTDSKDLYVLGYVAKLETKNLCKAWVNVYYDEERKVIYSKTKFGCL